MPAVQLVGEVEGLLRQSKISTLAPPSGHVTATLDLVWVEWRVVYTTWRVVYTTW